MRTVVLALLLGAAFGLKVKTEESFGLDQSLGGLPQKLAKMFALAATGKMTEEMMDTQLQEFFDAQRALPREQKQRLGKVIDGMFPEDSQTLEEVVEWKHTPFAQSLLQQTQKDPTDPMDKDDWNPYFDDWRERGTGRPTMRGDWNMRVNNGYNHETKLEKNLRLSEEEVARNNCIPDGLLSCFTKDITYLPCRTFNMCMGNFQNMANQHDFYAPHVTNIPRAMREMRLSRMIWTGGIGVCHAFNAAQAPWKFAPIKDLVDDYAAGGTELQSRLPCTIAYGQNTKVARLAQQLHNFELEQAEDPPERKLGAHGGKAAKNAHQEKQRLWNNFEFELGKEAGRWASDPVGEYEKHNSKNGYVANPEIIPTGVIFGDGWSRELKAREAAFKALKEAWKRPGHMPTAKEVKEARAKVPKDMFKAGKIKPKKYKEGKASIEDLVEGAQEPTKARRKAPEVGDFYTPDEEDDSTGEVIDLEDAKANAVAMVPPDQVQDAFMEALEDEMDDAGIMRNPDGAFERMGEKTTEALLKQYNQNIQESEKSNPDLQGGFKSAQKDSARVPSKKDVKNGAATTDPAHTLDITMHGVRRQRDADRAARDFARAREQWGREQADLIGKTPEQLERIASKKNKGKEVMVGSSLPPAEILAGMAVGSAVGAADRVDDIRRPIEVDENGIPVDTGSYLPPPPQAPKASQAGLSTTEQALEAALTAPDAAEEAEAQGLEMTPKQKRKFEKTANKEKRNAEIAAEEAAEDAARIRPKNHNQHRPKDDREHIDPTQARLGGFYYPMITKNRNAWADRTGDNMDNAEDYDN